MQGQSQTPIDTLKVMTYNTLNYGFSGGSSCPTLSTLSKTQYLREIIALENPDILGLEKMSAWPASFSTDSVVRNVLDSVCNGCYDHSVFTNHSGYYKENILYFKKSKIGYLGTTTAYSGDTAISDINMHRLYYKSNDLSQTHDTIFFNVYVAHLLSGGSNDSIRGVEVAGAMSWMSTHITSPGNYIFMGDLNTKSSSESCFQQLTSAPDINIRFFDPPNQVGNWNSHPASFAHYLTQSTRTNDPGDCGSVGGMDSRFDHILCSAPLILGELNAKYITNSYHVIGQDGLHVNAALTDPPTNTSVPFNVLLDLYYMSNHLPVELQLEIENQASGLSVTTMPGYSYTNPVNDMLRITSIDRKHEKSIICIYSPQGVLLQQEKMNDDSSQYIDVSALTAGFYLFRIMDANTRVFTGRFIKY